MTVEYKLAAEVLTESVEDSKRRTEAVAQKHNGRAEGWDDPPIGTREQKAPPVSTLLATLRFEGVEHSDDFLEALRTDLRCVFRSPFRLDPVPAQPDLAA